MAVNVKKTQMRMLDADALFMLFFSLSLLPPLSKEEES